MNLASRLVVGFAGLGNLFAALALSSDHNLIAFPLEMLGFALMAFAALAERTQISAVAISALPPALTAEDMKRFLQEALESPYVHDQLMKAQDMRDDEIDEQSDLLSPDLPTEEDDAPGLVSEIGTLYQWVLSPGSTTRTEEPLRAIVMHLHDLSRAWVSSYSLDDPTEEDGFDYETQTFVTMAAALRWVGGFNKEGLFVFDEGHPLPEKYAEETAEAPRVIRGARAQVVVNGRPVGLFDKISLAPRQEFPDAFEIGPFGGAPESDDFLSAYLSGTAVEELADQLAEESPSFIDEGGTERDLSLEEIKHIEGVKVDEAKHGGINYVLSLDADDHLQGKRAVAVGKRVFRSASSTEQPPADLINEDGHFHKLSEAVDWVIAAGKEEIGEDKTLETALFAGEGIPRTLVKRNEEGFWVLSDDFEGDLAKVDGHHVEPKAKRAVFTSLQRPGRAFRSAHSIEKPGDDLIDDLMEFENIGSATRWVQQAA